MIDPAASLATTRTFPSSASPTVAQQFWLSDHRCTNGGSRPHTGTPATHATHDTRGVNCAARDRDRPDALLTTAPDNLDITPDYATDLEPPRTDAASRSTCRADGCSFLPTVRAPTARRTSG